MNLKKLASFAFGPVIGAVLGLISVPVTTWLFSAEDIGKITMLQIGISFIVLFFSLGLDQAYVREYHDVTNRPALLKLTMLPGCLLLIISSATILLFFPTYLSGLLFGISSFQLSLLIVLVFISSLLTRFLSLIIRMQERGWAFSMTQILPKVFFLALMGMYILTSINKLFIYLFVANLASILVVLLVLFLQTRKEVSMAVTQVIDINKLREVLRYGLPLIVGGVAYWGLTSIDKVLLRSLSTFGQLGIYSVAVSFAAIATIFQTVFSTVWAPIVYKWASKNENLERIDEITEYVLAFIVMVFCMVGMFSWVISYLLPPIYKTVQYILPSCLGAPLLYTLSETTVVGIGLAKKTHFSMLSAIIAFLISLLLGYFLIAHFGAVGAAISTSFAFWFFLVMRTEFSSYVWRSLPRLKLYVCSFVCVVVSALFALCGEEFSLNIYGIWIVLVVLFCFVFKRSYIYAWKSIKALC